MNDTNDTTTPTLAERKTNAIKAKQELEDKRAAKHEEAAISLIELEVKCEAKFGARGSHYEIIDLSSLDEPPVVVKRGDSVVYKKFQAVEKKEDADIEDYVIPSLVQPDADGFRELTTKLPNVLGRVALAVDRLYGAKDRDDEGKF